MDNALRNKLWSAVMLHFFESVDSAYVENSNLRTEMQVLWIHFFKLPIDTLPTAWDGVLAKVRLWFFECKWNEVYDFIEALARELRGDLKKRFTRMSNSFLEQEMSVYRFVGDEIGEITSKAEIEAIEEAIESTDRLAPVNAHLRDALSKLFDRKNPDYRNSIKESISAVEALCRLITGDDKATLGDALKSLKGAGLSLHPALENAWSSLYGYTSDRGGIRHALSDSQGTTFAEAKYMLVSCSAFVTYLLQVSPQLE